MPSDRPSCQDTRQAGILVEPFLVLPCKLCRGIWNLVSDLFPTNDPGSVPTSPYPPGPAPPRTGHDEASPPMGGSRGRQVVHRWEPMGVGRIRQAAAVVVGEDGEEEFDKPFLCS